MTGTPDFLNTGDRVTFQMKVESVSGEGHWLLDLDVIVADGHHSEFHFAPVVRYQTTIEDMIQGIPHTTGEYDVKVELRVRPDEPAEDALRKVGTIRWVPNPANSR
jgi:hypothetical protein